jgi:methionyl-tRNA formyltransferase
MSISKISSLGRDKFYYWYNDQVDAKMKRLLFGYSESPSIPDCEDVLRSEINSEKNIKYLQSLDPDILLVCMAPILKPEVFSIPRIATVNIHFGIAPEYRGENTIFWPLYLADYENIGVTLHHINQGIDAGNILARGYPTVEKRDTETTLWTKCARLAAELTIDFLEAAQNGQILGCPQESKGHLFYRRDRKVWRDTHYFMKRILLNHKPSPQPERKIKFF